MSHFDGYLWLLALTILLAGATLYLGFFYPLPEPSSPGYLFWAFIRGKNKGAFLFVVLVLLPVSALMLWQATRVESRVAELVVPYPNVAETIVVPDVDQDPNSYQLLVSTGDSPAAVIEFYSALSHRRAWDLVAENDSMLHLVREDQRLVIVATADTNHTTIGYLVSGR